MKIFLLIPHYSHRVSLYWREDINIKSDFSGTIKNAKNKEQNMKKQKVIKQKTQTKANGMYNGRCSDKVQRSGKVPSEAEYVIAIIY